MYKIEIHGLDEWEASLVRCNRELKERAFTVMKENMEAAVQLSGSDASSRGWELAREIHLGNVDPDGLTVEGGCYAWYAAFPEFGTSKQVAKPFWRQYVWAAYFTMLSDFHDLMAEMYK